MVISKRTSVPCRHWVHRSAFLLKQRVHFDPKLNDMNTIRDQPFHIRGGDRILVRSRYILGHYFKAPMFYCTMNSRTHLFQDIKKVQQTFIYLFINLRTKYSYVIHISFLEQVHVKKISITARRSIWQTRNSFLKNIHLLSSINNRRCAHFCKSSSSAQPYVRITVYFHLY